MTAASMTVREGGCLCGAVRFRTEGTPTRAGLCHCLDCQRVHGSAFYAFAIFEADRVQLTGRTLAWRSTARYTRLACALCGSRVGARSDEDVELSLPLFDAPAAIEPQYELWVCRRVPWMPALSVLQYPQNRPTA